MVGILSVASTCVNGISRVKIGPLGTHSAQPARPRGLLEPCATTSRMHGVRREARGFNACERLVTWIQRWRNSS
ncbi:MAG: hypothetical protein QOJ06_1842 [Pseudonocardiales bacterium]|jgi:hypothetical protein|nr:hypothetical protein [Pseudonocardiales bacterium]